jgi:hypothetical protein
VPECPLDRACFVRAEALSTAAALLGVEAYHAGNVRTLLNDLAQEGATTPYGPIETVVAAISDLRDSVDGEADMDQGITDDEGRTNVVPTDENGLVYKRTVDQLLPIVYLGGESSGGFFPDGLNGFFGPVRPTNCCRMMRGPAENAKNQYILHRMFGGCIDMYLPRQPHSFILGNMGYNGMRSSSSNFF